MSCSIQGARFKAWPMFKGGLGAPLQIHTCSSRHTDQLLQARHSTGLLPGCGAQVGELVPACVLRDSVVSLVVVVGGYVVPMFSQPQGSTSPLWQIVYPIGWTSVILFKIQRCVELIGLELVPIDDQTTSSGLYLDQTPSGIVLKRVRHKNRATMLGLVAGDEIVKRSSAPVAVFGAVAPAAER